MEYTWKRTTHEVYIAIYNEHREDLHCYESYTKPNSHGTGLEAQITAWGFADARHPIIRSELSLGEWQYYILKAAFEEE